MRFAPSLFALALAAVPMLSHADYCSDASWKEHGVPLGHKRLHEDIEDQWSRCEIVTGKAPRAVIALAYPGADMTMPKTPGDALTSYEVEVLLIDTAANKVLSRQQLKRARQTDGSGMGGMEFDALQRQLAPGVGSIGVRLQHAGPSPKTIDSVETLTIYAIEKDTLRLVVDRFPAWTVVGAWDEKCDGSFTEKRTLLEPARTRSNGFADLALRITEDSRSTSQKGPNCVERKAKPVVRKALLRYEGTAYPVATKP